MILAGVVYYPKRFRELTNELVSELRDCIAILAGQHFGMTGAEKSSPAHITCVAGMTADRPKYQMVIYIEVDSDRNLEARYAAFQAALLAILPTNIRTVISVRVCSQSGEIGGGWADGAQLTQMKENARDRLLGRAERHADIEAPVYRHR